MQPNQYIPGSVPGHLPHTTASTSQGSVSASNAPSAPVGTGRLGHQVVHTHVWPLLPHQLTTFPQAQLPPPNASNSYYLVNVQSVPLQATPLATPPAPLPVIRGGNLVVGDRIPGSAFRPVHPRALPRPMLQPQQQGAPSGSPAAGVAMRRQARANAAPYNLQNRGTGAGRGSNVTNRTQPFVSTMTALGQTQPGMRPPAPPQARSSRPSRLPAGGHRQLEPLPQHQDTYVIPHVTNRTTTERRVAIRDVPGLQAFHNWVPHYLSSIGRTEAQIARHTQFHFCALRSFANYLVIHHDETLTEFPKTPYVHNPTIDRVENFKHMQSYPYDDRSYIRRSLELWQAWKNSGQQDGSQGS